MKHFNLKKLLLTLALVIVVQNGAIIMQNTDMGNGAPSEENAAMPYSDLPYSNDNES